MRSASKHEVCISRRLQAQSWVVCVGDIRFSWKEFASGRVSQLRLRKTISQYEDFETLNVQTALLDLSVLQDIRNCLELENICANCKRSRLTALGFQFLYQPRRFSGIQLVPVLLAGVWVVHTLCKTSQLNAWLALHYYDVFKYRVALYKWTALLSSFPQIIGTLLKKFQISLQLNPSHWQPSLTTNDCFSGNGAGA